MKFQNPVDGYFIYTKSNCKYCRIVKKLVPNAKIVNSDEYLKENRDGFLEYIDKLSGERPRTFPMVFLNYRFIGGYTETKNYIEELESFKFMDFWFFFFFSQN